MFSSWLTRHWTDRFFDHFPCLVRGCIESSPSSGNLRLPHMVPRITCYYARVLCFICVGGEVLRQWHQWRWKIHPPSAQQLESCRRKQIVDVTAQERIGFIRGLHQLDGPPRSNPRQPARLHQCRCEWDTREWTHTRSNNTHEPQVGLKR